MTDASVATIIRNIENDINADDMNSGIVKLEYCLRADLYDDSDTSFSVGAKKVNLHLIITYESESDFSIASIETSEFAASSSSATATRSVRIRVFKDTCTLGCEIVNGDGNECFTSDADKVHIGSILALCLKGDATDVELTGIESAKVESNEYSSAIVSFNENGVAGTNNFVTTTSVANGEVNLQTLLVPAYYDAQDGGADGFLVVSGTVLLAYIDSSSRRRGLLDDLHNDRQRVLQDTISGLDEKSMFSINIPFEKPNAALEIAPDANPSEAYRIGSIAAAMIIILVAGVA